MKTHDTSYQSREFLGIPGADSAKNQNPTKLINKCDPDENPRVEHRQMALSNRGDLKSALSNGAAFENT